MPDTKILFGLCWNSIAFASFPSSFSCRREEGGAREYSPRLAIVLRTASRQAPFSKGVSPSGDGGLCFSTNFPNRKLLLAVCKTNPRRYAPPPLKRGLKTSATPTPGHSRLRGNDGRLLLSPFSDCEEVATLPPKGRAMSTTEQKTL